MSRPCNCLQKRIQELEHELASLRDQVTQDPMTGLRNRRYFEQRLEEELSRSARDGRYCSVMVIDVDDFKEINDRHGHSAGDRVLHRLSASLRAIMRASDILARLGGDEFTVLLPETDEIGARHAALRLLEGIRIGAPSEGQVSPTVKFTVSIGIATSQPHRSTVEVLLAVADRMMYKTKLQGGGSIRVARQKLFGEWVVEEGIATANQVAKALDYAMEHNIRIGEALQILGFATGDQIEEVLQE